MRIAALIAAAVGIGLAVGFATTPELRRYVVAMLDDPASLPALESDPRVHYEVGARDCAEATAALLPGAMETVAAAQGRGFARAPIVAVYVSNETYARANMTGAAHIVGVSWQGRVTLAPTLCGPERQRLAAILIHELSHTHLFGWRSELLPRPPGWFTEGLAVMVSQGGGAEGVDAAQAAEAIRNGFVIGVGDAPHGSFGGIAFEREPPDNYARPHDLAYREAEMFVTFLRAENPAAFSSLLAGLYNGDDFERAFRAAYGTGVGERKAVFIDQISRH